MFKGVNNDDFPISSFFIDDVLYPEVKHFDDFSVDVSDHSDVDIFFKKTGEYGDRVNDIDDIMED